MKTLFVCSSQRVNRHVGEEYDAIVEVDEVPTVETIDKWAEFITRSIRDLHQQDRVDGGDGKVSVTLDGLSPYNAILLNLQVILKASDGIVIELPYLPSDFFSTNDRETKEMLSKIGERG